MEGQKQQQHQPVERKTNKSIYAQTVLNRDISVPINNVGQNIHQILEKLLSELVIGGKCVTEGFVAKSNIKLISYSTGIVSADRVIFNVVFMCNIFYPVEGMLLKTKVSLISIGGVSAVSNVETPSPFTAYLYKDHHVTDAGFNRIKIGDVIKIRVIGQRFSLNDSEITIIGKYIAE